MCLFLMLIPFIFTLENICVLVSRQAEKGYAIILNMEQDTNIYELWDGGRTKRELFFQETLSFQFNLKLSSTCNDSSFRSSCSLNSRSNPTHTHSFIVSCERKNQSDETPFPSSCHVKPKH